MQTRTITNLVLGIALAALVIFIYSEVRREANPEVDTLTPLRIEDVNRLTINNVRNQDIVLLRRDGHWVMDQPFPALANEARIEKLLGIVSARSQAQYSTTDVDLAQLRLINPDIRIHANDTEMLIGTTEPLEQRRYVLTGDRIHLIIDSYSFLAQGAATDFVDTKLLPGEPELASITLPDLRLQHSDDGWQVEGLDPQPAADSIQSLVDEWRQARALKVSREETAGLTGNIRIQLAGQSAPIVFQLRDSDNGKLLVRLDTGLAYQLHASSAQRLLGLQPSEPTANASGSGEPATTAKP